MIGGFIWLHDDDDFSETILQYKKVLQTVQTSKESMILILAEDQ